MVCAKSMEYNKGEGYCHVRYDKNKEIPNAQEIIDTAEVKLLCMMCIWLRNRNMTDDLKGNIRDSKIRVTKPWHEHVQWQNGRDMMKFGHTANKK